MLVPANFQPAPYLSNPHAQTIHAALLRRAPLPVVRRERVELPDGDFIDLDWTGADSPARPLVVVLHGLEGSIRSNYVRGLLQAIVRRGWQGAVLHFRGCSGSLNRLAQSYHSGATADVDWILRLLRTRFPQRSIAVVGYSLGSNVLLKWLGETGPSVPVQVAAGVSVPFVLSACVDRLQRGFSRLYQAALLQGLKRKALAKLARHPGYFSLQELRTCRTLRAFDDCVTARVHGFAGAEDYYRRCSCRQFLPAITLPTLILHALDDPFMTRDSVPDAAELPTNVRMELSQHGGHVGFIAATATGGCEYWLERRIPDFLAEHLSVSESPAP